MKLLINFNDGVYSSNKEKIKEVFKLLNYKYAGSNKPNETQMICYWKRAEDTKTIKAVFNGSGKSCQFIIDCKESELKIFQSFTNAFNCKVNEYAEKKTYDSSLYNKAKFNVDRWYTFNKSKQPGEPEVFYNNRMILESQRYEQFIQNELTKLKESTI